MLSRFWPLSLSLSRFHARYKSLHPILSPSFRTYHYPQSSELLVAVALFRLRRAPEPSIPKWTTQMSRGRSSRWCGSSAKRQRKRPTRSPSPLKRFLLLPSILILHIRFSFYEILPFLSISVRGGVCWDREIWENSWNYIYGTVWRIFDG